ncbi:MAG: PP2C family protein-serine/threonine phosphatase, partial [Bryobacteraceae bacterium]
DNARLYRRVERQNRTLATLAHLARDFSILDLEQLLQHIARAIKRLINYDAFSILLVDQERSCLRHRFSIRYDKRVELDQIPLGKGITGAAAELREVVRADDTLADPRYIPSHPDIRSEVAVPLIVRDRVIGVMDLESERYAYFTDEHVRMLSLLAPQIAIAVENARLYEELAQRQKQMEQDLEAARELQSALVWRTPPEIEGLELAVGYRPARQVTGDLCHFYPLDSGEALIALGDVSGKGVAAALYGALVNGLLMSLAPRRRSPAALLKALNQALLERQVYARYVTLLTLRWLPSAQQMVIANAGGMPPLLCRQGEILKPRVEGVPLGLLPDAEHEEVILHGKAGDLLLLYSDGVPDQMNGQGEDYGRDRLLDVVRRHSDRSPQELVNAIFADLDQFSQGSGPSDDQTILVLRLR